MTKPKTSIVAPNSPPKNSKKPVKDTKPRKPAARFDSGQTNVRQAVKPKPGAKPPFVSYPVTSIKTTGLTVTRYPSVQGLNNGVENLMMFLKSRIGQSKLPGDPNIWYKAGNAFFTDVVKNAISDGLTGGSTFQVAPYEYWILFFMYFGVKKTKAQANCTSLSYKFNRFPDQPVYEPKYYWNLPEVATNEVGLPVVSTATQSDNDGANINAALTLFAKYEEMGGYMLTFAEVLSNPPVCTVGVDQFAYYEQLDDSNNSSSTGTIGQLGRSYLEVPINDYLRASLNLCGPPSEHLRINTADPTINYMSPFHSWGMIFAQGATRKYNQRPRFVVVPGQHLLEAHVGIFGGLNAVFAPNVTPGKAYFKESQDASAVALMIQAVTASCMAAYNFVSSGVESKWGTSLPGGSQLVVPGPTSIAVVTWMSPIVETLRRLSIAVTRSGDYNNLTDQVLIPVVCWPSNTGFRLQELSPYMFDAENNSPEPWSLSLPDFDHSKLTMTYDSILYAYALMLPNPADAPNSPFGVQLQSFNVARNSIQQNIMMTQTSYTKEQGISLTNYACVSLDPSAAVIALQSRLNKAQGPASIRYRKMLENMQRYAKPQEKTKKGTNVIYEYGDLPIEGTMTTRMFTEEVMVLLSLVTPVVLASPDPDPDGVNAVGTATAQTVTNLSASGYIAHPDQMSRGAAIRTCYRTMVVASTKDAPGNEVLMTLMRRDLLGLGGAANDAAQMLIDAAFSDFSKTGKGKATSKAALDLLSALVGPMASLFGAKF